MFCKLRCIAAGLPVQLVWRFEPSLVRTCSAFAIIPCSGELRKTQGEVSRTNFRKYMTVMA